MGAVTFSLDTRLLEALKGALPLAVFVETGTFRGDGLATAMPHFSELHSVEFSEPLWREAKARFADNPKVSVVHGQSPGFLSDLVSRLSGKPTLFWLDAHWCVADDAAGMQSQCPLLDELSAIGRLGPESVILIDDARLFLAPPPEPHDVTQWPVFDAIVRRLRRASEAHEIMVVNDVIAFYPPAARAAVRGYARKAGVDWLRARQSLEENDSLREVLAARQALIVSQDKAIQEKEALIVSQNDAIQEKEAMIGTLAGIVQESSTVRGLLGRFTRAAIRAVTESETRLGTALLKPRLGRLRQHPPCALDVVAMRAVPVPPEPPGISIVTPSFRQAQFIGRTIESVLEQGYPNLEYWVQDGGSDDGTREILERYAARLAGWESVRDEGQSQAINRGFERTSGEIMAWLNSDDILLPGCLATVATFFASHPDVDVVYGHRVLIDEEDRQIGEWIMPPHDDPVLSWADFVPQETLFWRRRIWEKVGGQVDESFRFAMDWDLLVRMRDAGARFARIPRFLAGFRVHAQQKTSAEISDTGFREMQRIRKRSLGRVPEAWETNRHVLPYLLRHVAADRAWRLRRLFGDSG